MYIDDPTSGLHDPDPERLSAIDAAPSPSAPEGDDSTIEGLDRHELANQILIERLVAGDTQKDAGDAAGMSERTVRRRLDHPDIVRRIHELRTRHIDEQRNRYVGLHAMALDAITEALTTSEQPALRLRAALAILDRASSLEIAAIADRLSIVEQGGPSDPPWEPEPIDGVGGVR